MTIIIKTMLYNLLIFIISKVDIARLVAGALAKLIEYAATNEKLRQWIMLMAKRIQQSSTLVITVIEDGKIDETEVNILSETLKGWGAAERVKLFETALTQKLSERLNNATAGQGATGAR